MLKGVTIYRQIDLAENEEFASRWIKQGAALGLEMSIVTENRLTYGYINGKFMVFYGNKPLECSFVINRTRNSKLAKVLELSGIRVFNSSKVTEIANDKALTHIVVCSMGIKSLNSHFFNGQNIEQIYSLPLPIVVKNPFGFGGKKVFLAANCQEIGQAVEKCGSDEIVAQEFLRGSNATDIRCYCLGGEIIAAVKRTTDSDWRANYKLGSSVSLVKLSGEHELALKKILQAFEPDYVGIDFLQADNGKIYFNEIEDVVGSQSLYLLTDINIVTEYLRYIKGQL